MQLALRSEVPAVAAGSSMLGSHGLCAYTWVSLVQIRNRYNDDVKACLTRWEPAEGNGAMVRMQDERNVSQGEQVVREGRRADVQEVQQT